MKFKATSNPTKDGVPKVPGASRRTEKLGTTLIDGEQAYQTDWFIEVGNLAQVQQIAKDTKSKVFLVVGAGSGPNRLHVDSPAELDDDGAPEKIREAVDAHNPKMWGFGEPRKVDGPLQVQALDREGKERGDAALARADARLREKDHQSIADEVNAKLMGESFVNDVRSVAARTMLRTYIHEKDPKFAEALEDRIAALNALDALDDATLDAEVIKTVEWMKDVNVSQDRMFALLLRGLLCAFLQDRKLDGNGAV